MIEGKDLIITDPCYIAKDEDWGETFNWEDYDIEPFTQYEWDRTGYGDGSPEVFSVPSSYNPFDYLEKMGEGDEGLLSLRENIGECGVDSGSFGVFILEEALSYNPDFLNELPEDCYCIIRNFTGDIYRARDKKGYTHFILKPEDPKVRPIITD